MYQKIYHSPLGEIFITSDGKYLTGLFFNNSKNIKKNQKIKENDLSIFKDTTRWLDIYFSGKEPNFIPQYKIHDLTPFREEVIQLMLKIPFGKTVTYKDIAEEIVSKRKISKMSAQAVGCAVGWNPICLIIPCHRVVGAKGNLTGYSGGIENKIKLLKLEGNRLSQFFIPKGYKDNEKRCKWCNLKNPKYIDYHDNEWGIPNFNEKYLFEMLILESFQAGLSWECVLNKRDDFRKAYDDFDLNRIICYDMIKINELLSNEKIIRNRLKIKASINNAKIFKQIQEEFGSFSNYLTVFTQNKILYEINQVTNYLSDQISCDLQKRGMKFVGSTIIYSYLQAIGVVYSHDRDCFLYYEK